MSPASSAGPAAGLDGIARRLAAGLAPLPPSFRDRHSAWLRAAQRPDGGFAGRRGGSDIYYASFALRSAELLGISDDAFWRAAAAFVDGFAALPADVIECFCLLHAGTLIAERSPAGRREEARAGVMDIVRRSAVESGGYPRAPGGRPGVYHTFLAAQCCRLAGCELPGAAAAAAFVLSRACADGGYADSGAEAEGGTNPTAAAVTLLAVLGGLDGVTASSAANFLATMQRAEGGFAASARAPEADLLSTFTALVALDGLGALHLVKLAPAARFVRALEAPGGFRGGRSDDAADVEYTYYGLGTLGLLGWAAGESQRHG